MGSAEQDRPRRRARAQPGLLISGHEVPLPMGVTIVGRGSAPQISISSGLVSRRHLRLTNDDGRVTVEDLGSRNGVFVNGEPLRAPAILEEGDTLLVGTTEITFFFGASEEPSGQRVSFDEQGNLIPPEQEATERDATTLVRFEAPNAASILQLDREDITIQGSAPPPARRTAAPAPPLAVPSFDSIPDLPIAPGPLPKLAPIARVSPPSGSRAARSAPHASPAPSEPEPSTLRRNEPPLQAPPPSHAPSSAVRATTAPASTDPLSTVLGVVSRMLKRGDHDAAARALAPQIAKRIEGIRAGVALDPVALEATALTCLHLLSTSGDSGWFDRVIDLHSVARQLPRLGVLEEMESVVPALPAPSRERLAGYQALVRDLLAEVEADELELCDRVLALPTHAL